MLVRLPHRWSALCALAAVVLVGAVPLSGREQVTQPFVGVTWIERTEAAPRPMRMHVVQVDLRSPGVRLMLSPAAGGREVVRQTTLEFLREQHAQVAVNGHFFWPFPSSERDVEVIGLAASNGRVYSGFETPAQSYALVADAPAINIDRANDASVVHRDPARADGLGVVEPVELWTAVSGSAQIVSGGRVTLPDYRDAAHPAGALTEGGPGQYSNAKSWYDVVTARTALGLSRDRHVLTIFTVDARGGSLGMTVPEVAAVLVADYAAWDAINLDGGGSTSLAREDPETGEARLMTVSSDGPAGRAVGSSLAVFARRR